MGFRLGVVKPWKSRWYAEGNLADLIEQDEKIRNYLKARRDPCGDSTSGLSAHLHFGHISTLEIFWDLMDSLGWAYFKKGLYASAIGEFSDCLVKLPENPAVIYHLGMAYYKNGDSAKARVELEKALSLDENFTKAEDARRVLAEL